MLYRLCYFKLSQIEKVVEGGMQVFITPNGSDVAHEIFTLLTKLSYKHFETLKFEIWSFCVCTFSPFCWILLEISCYVSPDKISTFDFLNKRYIGDTPWKIKLNSDFIAPKLILLYSSGRVIDVIYCAILQTTNPSFPI